MPNQRAWRLVPKSALSSAIWMDGGVKVPVGCPGVEKKSTSTPRARFNAGQRAEWTIMGRMWAPADGPNDIDMPRSPFSLDRRHGHAGHW
jgi:hypothetical protein